jgi:PEP-CTERM motif
MRNFIRSTALAALLVTGLPTAQAAVQNYNFSGTLESGSFIGLTYSGSFSFDDLGLTGLGSEWLAVDSLSMSLNNATYTLADAAAPAEAAYFDGSFVGLSYSNTAGDPLFSLVAGNAALSEAFIAYDPAVGLSGTGNIAFAVAPIPEPETYAMLLAGLGMIGLAARRRRAEKV